MARSIVWLSRDNSIDGPDTWVQSLKGALRSLDDDRSSSFEKCCECSLRPRNRVLGAARKSNASPKVPISSRLMLDLFVVLRSVESVFGSWTERMKCGDNRYAEF